MIFAAVFAAVFLSLTLAQVDPNGATVLGSKCNFNRARDALKNTDNQQLPRLSSLSSHGDKKVNSILHVAKDLDVKQYGWLTTKFLANKATIEKTRVFKAIKALPKVANLRVQWNGMHDLTWLIPAVVQNKTLSANLYVQTSTKNLMFFSKAQSGWQQIDAYISGSGGDASALAKSYIFTQAQIDAMNSTGIYKAIENKKNQISGLLNYQPVAAMAFNKTIESMIKTDKIMWVDFRKELGPMYKDFNTDGTPKPLGINTEVEFWNNLYSYCLGLKDSRSTPGNPFTFMGFQIVGLIKGINATNEDAMVNLLLGVQNFFSVVAGYDIVANDIEDPESLSYDTYSLNVLKRIQTQLPQLRVPVYVTTGLSHWPIDMSPNPADKTPQSNLFDVLLLQPKRIGHGWSYYKHPYLLDQIASNTIPIEVAPIYNQLLGFSPDTRDHPAVAFARAGVTVTIVNEAPAFFGYNSLAYDWYLAFMSWGFDLAWVWTTLTNTLTVTEMYDDLKVPALQKLQTAPALWPFFQKTALNECFVQRGRRRFPVRFPPLSMNSIIPDETCLTAGGKVRFSTNTTKINGCVSIGARWNGLTQHLYGCAITDEYHFECDVPFLNETATIELSFNAPNAPWQSPTANNFTIYTPPTKKSPLNLVWDCSFKNVTRCLVQAAVSGSDDTTPCAKNRDLAICAWNAQCLDMAKSFCFQTGHSCSTGVCGFLSRLSNCNVQSWESCRAAVFTSNGNYCNRKIGLRQCAVNAGCGDMVGVVAAAPDPPGVKCNL